MRHTVNSAVGALRIISGPTLQALLDSALGKGAVLFKLADETWLEAGSAEVVLSGDLAFVTLVNAHDGRRYTLEYAVQSRSGEVTDVE